MPINDINNLMRDINVSLLSPSDEPSWQTYLNSYPDATIYHTLEWRDIIHYEYGFETLYLLAKEGGKVVGILPMFLVKNLRGRRLVSLPFSIYGGPLGDTGEVVSVLIEKSIELVRNGTASSLEIRPHKAIGDNIGLVSSEWGIGTNIDLTVGIDALWKGLTDRNDVNRAIRKGLNFRISDSEGIEGFYRLQLMTRKRFGLPTPTLKYYKSFFEKMPGMVKLALVENGNSPVAGGIFFSHKKTVLYVLGASDHRCLSSRPNDLLIWEMIKWGSENGYKTLDLGVVPTAYKGLISFKTKWGGGHSVVSKYIYPSLPSKVGSEGSTFFKVMPIGIAKVIGPKAIRLLG